MTEITEEELKRLEDWLKSAPPIYGQLTDEMLPVVAEVRRLREMLIPVTPYGDDSKMRITDGCLLVHKTSEDLDHIQRLIALGRAVEEMKPGTTLEHLFNVHGEWRAQSWGEEYKSPAYDSALGALQAVASLQAAEAKDS